jgi:hypothetical protein
LASAGEVFQHFRTEMACLLALALAKEMQMRSGFKSQSVVS